MAWKQASRHPEDEQAGREESWVRVALEQSAIRGLLTAVTEPAKFTQKWRFKSLVLALVTLMLAGFAPTGYGGGAAQAQPQIVFTRTLNERATPSLYLMSADGSRLHLFVRNAAAPAVSADGQSIAFVRNGELSIMRRDGSHARQVTRRPHNWSDVWDPAWAPSGQTLYFSRSSGRYSSASTLFSVGPDGSGLQQLTKRTSCDGQPTASPDGRVILFTRVLGDCVHSDAPAIRGINVSTGAILRKLPFRLPQRWLYDPAWSHDGTKIAYTSTCDRANTPPPQICSGLYVSDSNGARPRRLLSSNLLENSFAEPAWAPSGGQIAFVSQGTYTRLWTIDADGTDLHRLPHLKGYDSEPAWLPALP